MTPIKTQTLRPDTLGITQAVAIWRAGGLVAFPTETVYGLGADASNGEAVARIFAAKGRPAFNPLILHVSDLETAKRYAEFNPLALDLAQAFWPGPLTLVLPLKPNSPVSSLVSAGLPTVALRIPATPLATQILGAFGGAIAAPSANLSGQISPTTAAHVMTDLSGRIDAIIDAGPAPVGLESTILDPATTPPTLLRSGGLPAEIIEQMIAAPLGRAGQSQSPTSPGQLASHYAPHAQVRLNVTAPQAGALWLGFGSDCAAADANLSPSGDLTEAAANLFSHMHDLDAQAAKTGVKTINVAPIPHHGLGVAINDRLTRATT